MYFLYHKFDYDDLINFKLQFHQYIIVICSIKAKVYQLTLNERVQMKQMMLRAWNDDTDRRRRRFVFIIHWQWRFVRLTLKEVEAIGKVFERVDVVLEDAEIAHIPARADC